MYAHTQVFNLEYFNIKFEILNNSRLTGKFKAHQSLYSLFYDQAFYCTDYPFVDWWFGDRNLF